MPWAVTKAIMKEHNSNEANLNSVAIAFFKGKCFFLKKESESTFHLLHWENQVNLSKIRIRIYFLPVTSRKIHVKRM